jgi:CBS domain-containing protein
MLVRHLATQQVATVTPDATLADCARRMRDLHLGSVVVVDGKRPIGVVTDRDIVLEAVAESIDPASLKARDIMSASLATVAEDDDVIDALAHMREHGVRRVPVLGRDGTLAGIVALDDVVGVLAEQAAAVVAVFEAERARERQTRA